MALYESIARQIALALVGTGLLVLGVGCTAALGIEDLDYAANGGLTDRGLVARYHMDEASSGTEPTVLADSAEGPVPLTLMYEDGMAFAEVGGQRGLTWPTTGGQGRAEANIDGTKIRSDLEGSDDATIELVINVTALNQTESHLFAITTSDSEQWLSLLVSNGDRLQLYWHGSTLAGEWQFPIATQERLVMHVVLNTSDEEPNERVRLFVNGQAIGLAGDADLETPEMGDLIEFNDGAKLTLGNGLDGAGQNIAGTVFYAALYHRFVGGEGRAINYEILSERDDPVPAPDM